MPYMTGLLEGFQGRREAEHKQNYEREQQNRQMADRVFAQLLASNDTEMQQLALSGLMQPTGKKKGWAGFMGEMDTTNPIIQQIVARANEQVPDTSGAPTPPAAPGSAAMSTNQAVRPGAAPIQLPGQPLPPESAPAGVPGGGGPPDMAVLGPQGGAGAGMAMPPPPPPESKWKRRGTGMSTAEEIAESTARVGIEGRIKAITAALLAQGAHPEEIKRAVMGIAGAPQPLDTTANGPVLADPTDPATPIPTVRHRDGSMTLIDGSAVPPHYVGYVKPTTSGRVSKTIPDRSSPTGYMSVTYDPIGAEVFRVPAPEPTAPPTGQGMYFTFNEQGQMVPVVIPRNAPTGTALSGPAAAQPNAPTQDATAAIALLKDVQAAIAQLEAPRRVGQPVRKVTPEVRDSVVRQRAVRAGLSYRTYVEVEQAAQQTGAVQAGARGQGASVVERVRARALQNRGGGAGTPAPPVVPPPSAPARAQGAGPGR